jgi:hypothetical protein
MAESPDPLLVPATLIAGLLLLAALLAVIFFVAAQTIQTP